MISSTIHKYEQKTGETVTCPPECAIKIIGDEFMIWKLGIRDGTPYFWIDQTFGNMSNFAPFIREVCAAAGIEWLVSATQRDPKLYARKWKCVEVPEYAYEYEGRKYRIVKGRLEDFLNREGISWVGNQHQQQ